MPSPRPQAGNYAVWDRVGYERVRSPFDWRVDGGAWTTIKPDADTTDVEELQTWNPVAWLPLGAQTLTAGPHTPANPSEPDQRRKGQ